MENIHKIFSADAIARGVSNIFHPLVIVIPTVFIAMISMGIPIEAALLWTFVAVAIGSLPMAILVIWGVRSGRYSDASVSIREQRSSIYAVGLLCLVLLFVILIVGHAPAVITACLVSAIPAVAISYLINRRTKLSLHSAAMAGCSMVLLWTAFPIGVAMLFFTVLVAWARIRLRHHTPIQIGLGWVVPMICVFVAFRLMV